jgi:thiamine phosphate synthase YjbQ (UPF0047 family)
MKSYRKELWFNIPSRRGFKNITPDVEDALRESWVREGFVLVNVNLPLSTMTRTCKASRLRLLV